MPIRLVVLPGDAQVADVKAGKTFFGDSKAAKKTGTMPTKAIVAAAETYEEGYHAGNPGGLSAIEADLTPVNIKKDENIFGKVGTYVGAVPTVTEVWTPANGDWSENEWSLAVSGIVPASAKKVITSQVVYSSHSHCDDSRIRTVYNGVVEHTLVGDYSSGIVGAELDSWIGDGLGFSATLKQEVFHAQPAYPSCRWGSWGYYID